MKSDFKLSNLVGTVYRDGNLVFTHDGTQLLSPVGNRVSCFDLLNNKSFTFSYQHRKNIARIALNKQATLMITVDTDGRAILVNFVSRVVLHHFNFKGQVHDIQFSTDGHYFAVAVDRYVQIWKTPDHTEDRQFAPFVRYKNYAGHYNDVLSITWSADSRFLISTSKDLTARIYSLHSEDKEAGMTLAGHRDYVMRAFFSESQEEIYTISKDGALFEWQYLAVEGNNEEEEEEESGSDESGSDESEDEESEKEDEDMAGSEDESMDESNEENGEERKTDLEHSSTRNNANRKKKGSLLWRIAAKNYFHMEGTRVRCADFHTASNMLVVGFTNGEFRLYEIPEFNLIQSLSMGKNAVDSVTINTTGEWLAFGSAKAGQLLVYEWKSELYILKQQGHFDAMNSLCYSPDGSRVVTASEDGKVKVWDINSGFCLVTFTEHSAAVTAVAFAKKGHVLFTLSLDGTVRAYDLIRFRNFRTFTAPKRVQFSSMAVDPSGEVVVGGSHDEFDIYVWSVQTGSLLDTLAGHEGPISCLAFGTENSVLASASWDKTVRIWSIFARSQQVEPIEVEHDVLALAMRPDSKELVVSTLNGQLVFFDTDTAAQTHTLDIRKDVFAGRHLEDRFSAKNSSRARSFTTVAYSFDGLSVIAGGNNNSICLYDVADEVLLRRFVVSENMALDGTLTMLNSNKITDAGISADLLDRQGENSDREDRMDLLLPGSHRGDPGVRNVRPQVRVTSVQFSPSSSAFAAASTEGLLVYSTENNVVFDPFDLDMDVTPESVAEALSERSWVYALVMAFRLNEPQLVDRVMEAVPVADVRLVCHDLPVVYVDRLLKFVGDKLNGSEGSHHIEFSLVWVKETFASHGRYISLHKAEFQASIRLVQRFLARVAKDVVQVSRRSGYLHKYLVARKDDAETSQDEHGSGAESSEHGSGSEIGSDYDMDGDSGLDTNGLNIEDIKGVDSDNSDNEDYEEWHGVESDSESEDGAKGGKKTQRPFDNGDDDME